MRPDDIVRLTHMRDAAASALRFIDGKERADLDRNEMLLFAPVRAVEVIGEVAAKVSVEGQAEIPGIRWAAIVGMRNRLVHAYFDVERAILWATVSDELPPLKDRLSKVLDGLPGSLDDPGKRGD